MEGARKATGASGRGLVTAACFFVTLLQIQPDQFSRLVSVMVYIRS